MKKIQSILVLVLVLVSGYARSQCTNVRFTLTSGNAWPTVNPLAGNPQRICLNQNLAAVGPTVRVYTSAPVAISSVTWTVLGTGITKIAPENNSECGFQTTSPTAPFDFGKARVVVRYNAGVCGCIDTLDIFRQMSPANTSSFPPIQGTGCLTPGGKGFFYVEPRFSRPANVGVAIGLDSYTWSVSGTGIGSPWIIGASASPGLLNASGEWSTTEIQAPANWTSSQATINVIQGNTCNSAVTVPYTLSKGNPTASIAASAIGANYTAIVAGESYRLPTNSAQTITLTAPAGAITPYTWSQTGGFLLATSGSMNETCIVTPNSTTSLAPNNVPFSGKITLTSPGCSGAAGSSDFVEIQRTLVTGVNAISQPSGCQNAGNINLSVTQAPSGSPNVYTWSFAPASASAFWSFTSAQGSSTIQATALTNAPAVTFSVSLNGGPSITAGSAITINGTQGASVNITGQFPNYSVGATNITGLPACGISNLIYTWTIVGNNGNARFVGNTTTSQPFGGCNQRLVDVEKINSLNGWGGGVINLEIKSNCGSCTTVTCLVATNTDAVPLMRPAGGGGFDVKSKYSKMENLTVFPNPAKDILVIQNLDFQAGDQIEFCDLNGRVLESKVAASEKTELPLSKHSSGLYFIKYKSKTGVSRRSIVISE